MLKNKCHCHNSREVRSSLLTPLFRCIALVVSSYCLVACQNMATTDNTLTEAEQTQLSQANASLETGKIDLAIQQFQQLLKTNPAAKSGYTNLGLSYLKKEEDKQAKKAFLNAINQNKHDAIAYNHLAIIQRREGLFQLALGNYKKSLNANQNYANAHLNLGILYDIYLQELPKAREQYVAYQHLTNNSNKDVEKWLADLQRRIGTKQVGLND